jgi:endonuclease III
MSRGHQEQLRAMVDYILSPQAKDKVVDRMANDLANLVVATRDVTDLSRLLNSEKKSAQAVAASALHLSGPMACQLGSDLLRLLDHPDEYVRRIGEELQKLCKLED